MGTGGGGGETGGASGGVDGCASRGPSWGGIRENKGLAGSSVHAACCSAAEVQCSLVCVLTPLVFTGGLLVSNLSLPAFEQA